MRQKIGFVLCLLPLLSGQLCGSPEPVTTVTIGQAEEPVAPPAAPPASPTPTEPNILAPAVPTAPDPPAPVPPSVPEPEPPPPPPPQVRAKLVEALKVDDRMIGWQLKPEDITYFWGDECIADGTPGKPDPWGDPDPNFLFIDWYPEQSAHDIYVRFEMKPWPANIVAAQLEIYQTSYQEDHFFPYFATGLKVFRPGSFDWRPRPADPATWAAYCWDDLPRGEWDGGRCYDTPSSEGAWFAIDITPACELWALDGEPNYGLIIKPGDKLYAYWFASPQYPDILLRPKVRVWYRPLELKLPLEGSKAWMLTTEAGDGDCGGPAYGTHTGNNYFSLDFAPLSCHDGVEFDVEADVLVRATTEGVVSQISTGYNGGYGNTVVVKHSHFDEDDPEAGYTTRYSHLADNSIQVILGDPVKIGTPLGIMGNTGFSVGRHLDFGVRYNGSGASDVPELANVVMEGRPLKDWKTGCLGGVRNLFYVSNNASY